jgi:hypothetical protein
MQVMQAQPPDLIGKEIARRLFIRLAAESSEDMLPLCQQIAELEERKQQALAGLAECPGKPSGEITRLIMLQQSQIIFLKTQSKQIKGG